MCTAVSEEDDDTPNDVTIARNVLESFLKHRADVNTTLTNPSHTFQVVTPDDVGSSRLREQNNQDLNKIQTFEKIEKILQ